MIQLLPVTGIPEVAPGSPLGEWIARAIAWEPSDVVVIAQKIVSKAEGRIVRLSDVQPSEFATRSARESGRDPRLIEIVLRESRRIVRMDHGVMISETAHGFVCANAGVDLSNVDGGASATLLPVDPDASAERLARAIEAVSRVPVGVIVSDTFGRPWREGLLDVAIGVSGFSPLSDCRGQTDTHGYPLQATILADADQLAAAAGLVFRKTARVPACVVRGFTVVPGHGKARELIRPANRDMFR